MRNQLIFVLVQFNIVGTIVYWPVIDSRWSRFNMTGPRSPLRQGDMY